MTKVLTYSPDGQLIKLFQDPQCPSKVRHCGASVVVPRVVGRVAMDVFGVSSAFVVVLE